MKHPEWSSENVTWHPSIVEGACRSYFGDQSLPASEHNPSRKSQLIGLVAATTWFAFLGATETARTGPSESALSTYSFSPDLGEIYPVIDSFGTQLVDASTAYPLPEVLDRARSTLERFKGEVLAWHSHLQYRQIEGLNKRLEYLFEDEPELSKAQATPNMDSFGVFLAFLAQNPDFKIPSIGYNRDGVFSATWVGDKKLRMTLDFISSSSIRWVFVDSRNGLSNAVTGAGIVPLNVLAGVLSVYGAIGWIKS